MSVFRQIPVNYRRLCGLVESLNLPPKEVFQRLREDLDGCERRVCVGVGRTGEVADIFKSFLRNLGYGEVFGPGDIPYVLKPQDLVMVFSGSGASELPLDIARIARKVKAKVVGWTSNLDSELARLSDYVVHIEGKAKVEGLDDYYGRQMVGEPFSPLTPLGTLFELRLLFTTLSLVREVATGLEVEENYRHLCSLCKQYMPDLDQFEKLYNLIPRPRSLENPLTGKTVVVGEGFSGMVGKFFTTRFRHCAGKDEERDVGFYTDKGSVSVGRGDLTLIISGSAKEKFYNLALKVKRKGAGIGLITSFPDSKLAEVADAVIIVPGRVIEKVEGLTSSYYPRDPEKSIFEIRSLLSLETFVHAVAQKEGITEEDMRRRHSDFT